MRHHYSGRKLNRTASHRKALLSNLATSLFEHKKLVTTLAKAKELRPFAEQLITRARKTYSVERNGAMNASTIHHRRMVGRFIRNKAVLQELFDTIAPVVSDRAGGYTRIVKLGLRRGDAASTAVIELVDWSNAQDGRVSQRAKRPATRKTAKASVAAPAAAAVSVSLEADEFVNVGLTDSGTTVETVATEIPTTETAEIAESVAEALPDSDSVGDSTVAEPPVEEGPVDADDDSAHPEPESPEPEGEEPKD